MTIYDIIFTIVSEYKLARNHKQYAGNELGDFIRNRTPAFFNKLTSPDYPNICWHASAGIGRWVTSPWIAALHLRITDSPQRGYYPVYLFSSDIKNIYLSFNLGISDLRNEIGDVQALSKIDKTSLQFREKLYKDWIKYFSSSAIDLKPEYPNSNLEFYEHGHIFGKAYSKYSLPRNDVFQTDLMSMLDIYVKAVEQYNLRIND